MNEIAVAEIQMTPTPSPGPREQLTPERKLLERLRQRRLVVGHLAGAC